MSGSVLVTGGAGFIGSHLVRALLTRGDQVRVLDDLSTGRLENLAGVEGEIELVQADLRDLDAVRAAAAGAELILHLGALPSVPRSIRDPVTTTEVNATGTLNALIAARDQGARRLVLASSSSVYGSSGSLPRAERARPLPESPYGASKLAAEAHCLAFDRVYPVETVALRYFNAYGPRQDADSEYAAAIPRFISLAAAGEPLPIFGDGGQSRDFTFVSDVVEATLLASRSPSAPGEAINVASGRAATVNEVAAAIGALLGRAPDREQLPPRPGEPRDSWASVERARELLDYEPRVSLEEGLALTATALLGSAEPLRPVR